MNLLQDLFGVFQSRRGTAARQRRGGHQRSRQRGGASEGSRSSQPLAIQPMEPRIALAVDVFTQAPYRQANFGGIGPDAVVRDGWSVILGDSDDDIYIQQVATVPQALLVADNSSFVNPLSVSSVDALRSLHVTNGERRSDSGVLNDNYPVYEFDPVRRDRVTTRFRLAHDEINSTTINGTLSYRQADGTQSSWNFLWQTVPAPAGLRFTSPNSGTPGYIEPTGIRMIAWVPGQSQNVLEVDWQVNGAAGPADRLSPFSSIPIIDEVRYQFNDETVFGLTQKRELSLRPSARALLDSGNFTPTVFSLPNATGAGASGIVPGTLSGRIFIDGSSFPFHVESRSSNRLVFGGGDPVSFFGEDGDQFVLITTGIKPKRVTGVLDPASGQVLLEFASTTAPGPIVANELDETPYPQDPGEVSLSANYAVYRQGDPNGVAGSTTFFAGHDITREVSVDLMAPGATINVDSPILMSSGLTGGDISLRATNVNVDAQLFSNDRLDVGGSVAPRSQASRQAAAVAEVIGGVVRNLFIPSGFAGVGYDADNPPTVTISSPNGERNAVLGGVSVDRNPVSLTFGQITGIAIVDPGFGYAAAPVITIDSPTAPGGTQATAVATLDAQGRVSGITITNPGSGYQADSPFASVAANLRIATATANVDAFGRISGLTLTNPGAGYAVRPTVTIAPPRAVSSAVLGAVTVGSGPLAGMVTAIAVANPGYGYVSPPRVWIAPPPEAAGGTQATAVATIDNEGRVTGITITDVGSGYETVAVDGAVSNFVPEVRILAPSPIAQAETVRFNASVGANVYEIHVGDDTGTDLDRGLMLVSQTGSLAREFFLGSAADSVFVQAVQSDVVVEGTIWARNHTYLMQSLPGASDLAPYLLTTTSVDTGASVGTIRGGTVGITLANDAPTPAEGAVAYNDVQLRTDIDSLRIRAATSAGATRSEPFPYELLLEEENSIAIEAVAASSFPLTMAASQNLLFNATLATASDVNILAGSLFTLSAPVSTTKGRIGVVAQNIAVENSLRVTAADVDDTREDILLEATGGNIAVAGLVSAVNNVTLRQVNRTRPAAFDYSNRDPIAIPDNATVVRAVSVGDSFIFEDLDVAIDINHTFVGDLSAVLVAPDGTRIRLFTAVGGGGDNFTGTIFDSEAATPISAGTAPFTGRFRPQDSLAPLYGRDARGTWRLEVTDSSTLDTGTLTNFTLSFSSPQPAIGRISGPARIRADHLTIDAEGVVGNPDAAPGLGSYYLRTNVHSLSGRAGESMSIDELNDIAITDLRAGGLVSLRANGADPATGPNAGKAALTASLADVSAIDVNAPAGSIDVVNNAPRTIILGNSEALRRNRAISMVAGGNVDIRSTGGATRGEIFALDAPLAGSGARTVRYLYSAASLPAGAVYASRNPGTTASTITGPGSLAGVLGVAAANLRVSDRILVSVGASNQANGVYTVTRLSGPTGWLLTRSADSDTAAELPTNTIVRVTDGAATGTYRLTYTGTAAAPFARCPIAVAAVTLRTNIGSDDPNDLTTFVVSTAGGTNRAAGSLGKMIRLRQENDTSSELSNPNQRMDFKFSGQVLRPIRLTQQLPLITEPFTIDGNTSYNPAGSPGANRPRITVDGSRVSQTRDGNAVTAGTVVNGFEISGAGAAGGVLSNMTVAGFTKGAAVQVQDASTILVSGMTIGSTEIGLRVPNEFGVRVAGNSSEVTLLNSTVTASTKAGVRVQDAASQVVLVGNTIGVAERDNAVGVQFAGSGTNRLGVEPVLPLTTIPTVNATLVNATTFTLPAAFRTSAASLFVGLGVTGPGITASGGAAAAVIQSVATDATSGITTVIITGGTVTASGRVTFGNFANTVLGTSTLTLPTSISSGNLYLGQSIAGTGIAAGTRIIGITRSAATTLVTLSSPMTRSGVSSITFPGPNSGAPRNVVQNNLVGVQLLGSGATTIVNTSIINNAGDGIRIAGGTNTIGRTDRTRSSFSNVIFGNGGFGIVFDAGAGSRTDAVNVAGRQIVRGNFLGVTSGNDSAASNTKGNIGLRFTAPPVAEELYPGEAPDFRFRPSVTTGVDNEGNQHNGSISSPTDSGGPPRRGVPPLPPSPR